MISCVIDIDIKSVRKNSAPVIKFHVQGNI